MSARVAKDAKAVESGGTRLGPPETGRQRNGFGTTMRVDVGRECHLGVGVLFVEERHGSRDRYGYLARRIVLLFETER